MYSTFFYPCTEKIANKDYKTISEFLYQKKWNINKKIFKLKPDKHDIIEVVENNKLISYLIY